MLQADGEQAVGFLRLRRAGKVLIAEANAGRTLHLIGNTGHRDAAFRVALPLRREPFDDGVHIDPEGSGAVEFDHRQSFENADMSCGYPDAGGGAHCGCEIVRKAGQSRIEGLDCLAGLTQARVGIAYDGEEGHGFSGRRFFHLPSRFAAAGKCRASSRRTKTFDLHGVATACEKVSPRRLLPLSTMDRADALG